MRYQAITFTTLAIAAAVGGLGLACGGSASTSGADPTEAVENVQSAGELSESVATPHRPLYPMGRAKASGTGIAEWSVCSGGKLCEGAGANTQFFGQFVKDDADGGSGCTVVASSPDCVAETCTGGSPTPGVSAGTLSYTEGSVSGAIAPAKSEDFQYLLSQSGIGFAAGDTLTISGSGAAVPAFAAESVVAPQAITLSSPAANKKGAYDLPTSSALAVAWTGGSKGGTVFLEGESEGGSTLAYFSCGWDASAGKGSVPSTMLAPLAGERGDLYWGQEGAVVTFDAGKYSVQYVADMFGGAPAKFK